MIDCPNAQFISRNLVELAEVIVTFKELDAVYSGNLSLYMDANTWEVFDVRRGITIFHRDFKHVRQLCQDMRILKRDFANLYMCIHSISRGRQPNLSESVSIKHIYKIYGMDNYIFTNNAIKKFIYGKLKEKQNQGDNY